MLEHGDGLVFGEFAAIQSGALAFGEALLTGPTGQHTGCFVGSVAETNPQIVQAPAAVVIAVGVLAAEGFQVVHRSGGSPRGNEKVASQLDLPYKAAGTAASLVGHYRPIREAAIPPLRRGLSDRQIVQDSLVVCCLAGSI